MSKPIRTKEMIIAQFLEGLNQSAGAAGLLIHHQQNVQWMKMRAILEAVKKIVIADAVDPMLKPQPKKE